MTSKMTAKGTRTIPQRNSRNDDFWERVLAKRVKLSSTRFVQFNHDTLIWQGFIHLRNLLEGNKKDTEH
jgi:hypothetical protein